MCMCMGWADGVRGLYKAHKANWRGEDHVAGGVASSTSGVDTKK